MPSLGASLALRTTTTTTRPSSIPTRRKPGRERGLARSGKLKNIKSDISLTNFQNAAKILTTPQGGNIMNEEFWRIIDASYDPIELADLLKWAKAVCCLYEDDGA